MHRVLSICTGMGLLDKGFADAGFKVVGGCEIHPPARLLYRQVMGHDVLYDDLLHLVEACEQEHPAFDGIIGGPPCQSHSRLRARWNPKFPDLTPLVERLVKAVRPKWAVFENVVALDLSPEAAWDAIKIDAMHYGKPHQSRPRWFTHTTNITPPPPLYAGTGDDLVAYPAVYGKLYGRVRAAIVQGWPQAAELDAPAEHIVMGLANAVHLGVARAWGEATYKSMEALGEVPTRTPVP